LFRTSHLPPQSLVAVIPFDAMNATTGPTEHRLGSHVQMGAGYWDKYDHADVSFLNTKKVNTKKYELKFTDSYFFF
jgi:predicted nucleotidyltransferase